MALKYAAMSIDETTNPSKPHEARTPTEVTDFNDRVWDMVLRKIHVVALFVFLQIVLVSFFQIHPAYRAWSGWVYGGQFFGAWTVFYGTLLRDMGFRSQSGFLLFAVVGVGLLLALISDPLAWSDGQVRALFLGQIVAALALWLVTMLRWRILKGQFLKAQEKGMLP